MLEQAASGLGPQLSLAGGLDPTGGAGLLRDVWVAREHLGTAAPLQAIVTMWTWQGDGRPARFCETDASYLRRSFDQLRPGVLKVGAIGASGLARLTQALDRLEEPPLVVLDPVLRASDGGNLGEVGTGLHRAIERATMVTPNLLEARRLVGGTSEDPQRLIEELTERFPATAILLKGGHSANDESQVVDWLSVDGRIHHFSRNRCNGPDPRGTGCALASAIACALLKAATPLNAAALAIGWLDRARQRLRRSKSGSWHLRIDGDRLPAREAGSEAG